jgi:hypothetical protein
VNVLISAISSMVYKSNAAAMARDFGAPFEHLSAGTHRGFGPSSMQPALPLWNPV